MSAIASALPQWPHETALSIKQRDTPEPAAAELPPQAHEKRGITTSNLIPGNPDQRISGLPPGFAGIFSDITAFQTSVVVVQLFIQFFKRSALKVIEDLLPDCWIQRIDGGSLILEIWNEDPTKVVTQEFVQATLLWLLGTAQRGWTGFFVARVLDRATREWFQIRLVNPNMLAGRK